MYPLTQIEPSLGVTGRVAALNDFFDRRAPLAAVAPGLAASVRQVHELFITAALDITDSRERRRTPSIALDGTPLFYSMSADADGGPCAFRMVVEPGGIGITVAQQIATTLATVDAALGLLNWRAAAPQINRLVRAVYPLDAEEVAHWWGGMWAGIAAAGSWAELRLYMNLRHGAPLARWQRVADALAPVTAADFEMPFRELMSQVAPIGLPVGLAAVVRNGALAGVRLYVAVHEPSPELAAAAARPAQPDAAGPVADLCRSYADAFGGIIPSTALTVGYDLAAASDGVLRPPFARFKADLGFCRIDATARARALRPWIASLFADTANGAAALQQFLGDLDASTGAHVADYVSVGWRADTSRHVTVYVRPCGYAA